MDGNSSVGTEQRIVWDFARRHVETATMLDVAFSDYIAARACVRFSCLFQAAILGEQALEKAFKAGLRLSGDAMPFKKMSHKISQMSVKLGKETWFHHDTHSRLVALLEHHFWKSRYPRTAEDPDYDECRQGIALTDFRELDCMMLDFYDSLPVPEEVRVRIGVHAAFHNKKVIERHGALFPQWEALSWENQALAVRLPEIERSWEERSKQPVHCMFPGLFFDEQDETKMYPLAST